MKKIRSFLILLLLLFSLINPYLYTPYHSDLNGGGHPGYAPILAYKVSVSLGTPSATESTQAFQVLEHVPLTGNSFRNIPISLVWGTHGGKAFHLLHMYRETYFQPMNIL
jgi:hypothetical protein